MAPAVTAEAAAFCVRLGAMRGRWAARWCTRLRVTDIAQRCRVLAYYGFAAIKIYDMKNTSQQDAPHAAHIAPWRDAPRLSSALVRTRRRNVRRDDINITMQQSPQRHLPLQGLA